MNRHVLSACEPQAVFRFLRISAPSRIRPGMRVPWLITWRLSSPGSPGCPTDAADNLLLRLPASAGCEGAEPVLLRDTWIWFREGRRIYAQLSTDGLTLSVEDSWIRADRTTLGGDDGVAVAMMLALLTARRHRIRHWRVPVHGVRGNRHGRRVGI